MVAHSQVFLKLVSYAIIESSNREKPGHRTRDTEKAEVAREDKLVSKQIESTGNRGQKAEDQ